MSSKPLSNQEEQPTPPVSDSQEEAQIEEPEAEHEVYTCPVPECGKTFDKETSLRMHMLRSHRISPHGEAEGKPKFERVKREAKPVTISTEADLLASILKAVKYDKIDACVKLCDSYGYTVDAIYQALKQLGAPISVIRPTISWWSSYHDEYVPPSLAKELQMIQPRYYPQRRRTWYERGYPASREETESGGGLLHGMAAVIRSMKESEGANQDPQLMREIGALETRVEQILNRPVDTGNSQVVSSLSKQVSDLSAKLEAEKEKRVMDRFDSLEKRMEEISKHADKDALVAAVHGLENIMTTFIKGVTIGFNPENPPPKREKVKTEGPSLLDMIPEEYQE